MSMIIGDFPMPENFRYLDVYLKGKPRHAENDPFSLLHPPMECRKRAKIFSPFAALKGCEEAVAAQEILYIDRPELSDEDRKEIGRRLGILHRLTRNGREARENQVKVTVAYFVPCTDRDHPAYGHGGRRVSVSGICRCVDAAVSHSITVDGKVIRFQDILAIDADGIFDMDWEYDVS